MEWRCWGVGINLASRERGRGKCLEYCIVLLKMKLSQFCARYVGFSRLGRWWLGSRALWDCDGEMMGVRELYGRRVVGTAGVGFGILMGWVMEAVGEIGGWFFWI